MGKCGKPVVGRYVRCLEYDYFTHLQTTSNFRVSLHDSCGLPCVQKAEAGDDDDGGKVPLEFWGMWVCMYDILDITFSFWFFLC